MIVSNASPLIALGKQGMLHLLKGCFQHVEIPPSVLREITHGSDGPEVLALKHAIAGGWMRVRETSIVQFLEETASLGEGEKEAISLAAERKAMLFVDDKLGKAYARVLGVEAHGTLFVLALAYHTSRLTKQEVHSMLDGMMREGFYLSADSYRAFAASLDAMK